MSDWLCILRPPRPTFVSDMRDDEQTVMREHFAYLERLVGEGKVLLAGPSLDPPFGIVVLVAESEAEAWAIVRADPSVVAGVQTPELYPFRTSLLAGRD